MDKIKKIEKIERIDNKGAWGEFNSSAPYLIENKINELIEAVNCLDETITDMANELIKLRRNKDD